MISPTLNYEAGHIASLPVIKVKSSEITIEKVVAENVALSKLDWDMHETSWDFKKYPVLNYGISIYSGLVDSKNIDILPVDFRIEKAGNKHIIYESNRPKSYTIGSAYDMYKKAVNTRFATLKENEEELNRIFIDIYGLEDELTPEVADKDITVAKIFDKKEDIYDEIKGNKYILTKTDVIKSFISYAVGCMFGRYSLDEDGLIYAGGSWDDSKYSTFIPDVDNCIPITDEDYFEDDIVGLFVNFVKTVYGESSLEENLEFIADALATKGNTARQSIRNYFLKDYYKDHVKRYKKRPIYWLYDSGKHNGFKALIYMHRYNADTTGGIRVNYLHKMQNTYEKEKERMQEMIDNSTNAREIAQAEKRKEKLIKQLKEVKEYDEKVAHIALSRVEIDLDDGVKVNHDKVQTDRDGKKLAILAKI